MKPTGVKYGLNLKKEKAQASISHRLYAELNKKGFNFNSWERKRDLNAIYIPLSTASQYLRSNSAVDYIYAQSKDAESYHKMKNDITHLLLAKHKMAHDFTFNDIGAEMLKVTKEIEDMMKKWSITLMIIAGISLFVGGIGLFSTLLISISERMMEIGIRKSIGASERDVFGLFLSESLILSIIAAVQGIFISWVIVTVASSSLDFDFVLPINGVFIGIGFSLFIGFVSGIFPHLFLFRQQFYLIRLFSNPNHWFYHLK